jgi:hypothetical protein
LASVGNIPFVASAQCGDIDRQLLAEAGEQRASFRRSEMVPNART